VNRHERVTNAVVREKYGIDGRQYADLAALRGDPSDGLPGVSGIGEKTAAALLQRFDTMGGLREAAEDPASNIAPSPRRKIREAADYLDVASTVVAVARDIRLGSPDLTLPLSPAHPDDLLALADKWNLESPIARLVDTLTGLR
jgi:5'-3' exonuclease